MGSLNIKFGSIDHHVGMNLISDKGVRDVITTSHSKIIFFKFTFLVRAKPFCAPKKASTRPITLQKILFLFVLKWRHNLHLIAQFVAVISQKLLAVEMRLNAFLRDIIMVILIKTTLQQFMSIKQCNEQFLI